MTRSSKSDVNSQPMPNRHFMTSTITAAAPSSHVPAGAAAPLNDSLKRLLSALSDCPKRPRRRTAPMPPWRRNRRPGPQPRRRPNSKRHWPNYWPNTGMNSRRVQPPARWPVLPGRSPSRPSRPACLSTCRMRQPVPARHTQHRPQAMRRRPARSTSPPDDAPPCWEKPWRGAGGRPVRPQWRAPPDPRPPPVLADAVSSGRRPAPRRPARRRPLLPRGFPLRDPRRSERVL